jgi:hypothetical protein
MAKAACSGAVSNCTVTFSDVEKCTNAYVYEQDKRIGGPCMFENRPYIYCTC